MICQNTYVRPTLCGKTGLIGKETGLQVRGNSLSSGFIERKEPPGGPAGRKRRMAAPLRGAGLFYRRLKGWGVGKPKAEVVGNCWSV